MSKIFIAFIPTDKDLQASKSEYFFQTKLKKKVENIRTQLESFKFAYTTYAISNNPGDLDNLKLIFKELCRAVCQRRNVVTNQFFSKSAFSRPTSEQNFISYLKRQNGLRTLLGLPDNPEQIAAEIETYAAVDSLKCSLRIM